MTRISLPCMSRILTPVLFLWEYLNLLLQPTKSVSHSTYLLNRRIFSLTNGLSKIVLSFPYKLSYLSRKRTSVSLLQKSNFQTLGCTDIQLPRSVYPIINSLRASLQSSPLLVSGKRYTPELTAASVNTTNSLEKYSAARLFLPTSHLTTNPYLWEFIQTANLISLAEQYASCPLYLVSVSSWFVVPLIEQSYSDMEQYYSSASQLYHYDMDWISSIKIFVYLSDVSQSHAPFEFVLGSHKPFTPKKKFNMRSRNLPPEHSKNLHRFVGKAGFCFMMDSSGIHRDSIASIYARHVLQLEFAPSLFGASKKNADELSAICSGYLPYKSMYPGLCRNIPLY